MEALVNKANVLIAQENLNEAVKLLQKAASIRDSPYIHNAHGIIA